MTLEQLRIFVAVAEREHVTRAAQSLGLTQSAVSASIASLESRYMARLFHRVGRRIELTDAGRLFLGEARAVLARADTAELALAELGGLKRGVLLVHASQTIASYWLPSRLVDFHRRHPNLQVSLVIGNTLQVTEAVSAGQAEIGFVEGLTEKRPSVHDQAIPGDRLVVVVGPDHPWAGRRALPNQDLMAGDWVLRERGSGTRSEFELALAGLGLASDELNVVLELPSNESVRAAVEAGAGATAISELVVEPPVRLGTLCRVPFQLPRRQFHILRHSDRYLSEAAQAFLDFVGMPA